MKEEWNFVGKEVMEVLYEYDPQYSNLVFRVVSRNAPYTAPRLNRGSGFGTTSHFSPLPSSNGSSYSI